MALLSMSSIANQNPTTQLDLETAKSPKRKRQTSLSASDSLFAPDLLTHTRLRSPDSRLSSSPTPPSSPQLKPSHHPSTHLFSSSSSPTSTPKLQIPLLEEGAIEGADSPRSAVARRLEGLDIALRGGREKIPLLKFGDAESADRKKVKLDPEAEARAETEAVSAAALNAAFDRSISPTNLIPRVRASTLDESAESSIIWWSDTEITGHLGLDPEDDGYGINGIGFKPTPAMAAARSVKRRRQIEEWRTRELREERRRRAEGRRRIVDPGGGAATGAGIAKRTVRFAGSL